VNDGGRADDEPPPILGSWGRLYALVIAALVAIIVLLVLLTRAYAT
jgi:hypothetical protein